MREAHTDVYPGAPVLNQLALNVLCYKATLQLHRVYCCLYCVTEQRGLLHLSRFREPPFLPITSPMFPCSNAKFTGKLLPNPNFLLTGLLCQVKLLLKHLFFQTVNDEGLRALSFFWSDCLSLFMMCRYFTLSVVSDIKIMNCQAALPFLTKKARDEDTHRDNPLRSAVFYIITHTFILFISCFQVFHKERYHREAQYEDTHIILSPSLFSAKIIRFALSRSSHSVANPLF